MIAEREASREAPHSAAIPIGRHTPRLSETVSYQAALFTASISSESISQHIPTPSFPAILASDDLPVTVPVLSAQITTERWEHVRDDDPDDIETIWPDDQVDAGDEEEDLDEEPLEIPDGITRAVFRRDEAFAFRERSWEGWKRHRKTVMVMSALVLMLMVAIIGAVAAVSYARRATQHLTMTPPTPTTSSYSGGVVVQPGQETVLPTPEAPKYQIGIWVSNNAPSGGTVKVFVRVSDNIAPMAHIPVTLMIQTPGGTQHAGPTKTDGYGLATFTVHYGGVSGTPVFVTAITKIGTMDLSAETVFVPI